MPTTTHQIMMFGKLVDLPRLQLCYGESYNYSGTTSHAIKEIPELIQRVMNAVNAHYMKSTKTSQPIYSMCLVNYYRDGNDYIGFHSDDEVQLVPGSPIYSVSFGATRKFKLNAKEFLTRQSANTLEQCKLVDEIIIEPESSDLLIMGGTCQSTHTHSVPKQKSINDLRINLTFRAFKKNDI
jgi:alkylated DNA repair dioxygenase AlkB